MVLRKSRAVSIVVLRLVLLRTTRGDRDGMQDAKNFQLLLGGANLVVEMPERLGDRRVQIRKFGPVEFRTMPGILIVPELRFDHIAHGPALLHRISAPQCMRITENLAR